MLLWAGEAFYPIWAPQGYIQGSPGLGAVRGFRPVWGYFTSGYAWIWAHELGALQDRLLGQPWEPLI